MASYKDHEASLLENVAALYDDNPLTHIPIPKSLGNVNNSAKFEKFKCKVFFFLKKEKFF
jgi:hypothetical protein